MFVSRPLTVLALVAMVSTTPALRPAAAQGFSEPPAGTTLRADILDAMRPHAEWSFGAPVEFVVREMRVAGDTAFVWASAQRPGGGTIALADTPLVQRDGRPIDLVDGPEVQALLKRSGRTWVAVHHAEGATDAWWWSVDFCPGWGEVLPNSCG